MVNLMFHDLEGKLKKENTLMIICMLKTGMNLVCPIVHCLLFVYMSKDEGILRRLADLWLTYIFKLLLSLFPEETAILKVLDFISQL